MARNCGTSVSGTGNGRSIRRQFHSGIATNSVSADWNANGFKIYNWIGISGKSDIQTMFRHMQSCPAFIPHLSHWGIIRYKSLILWSDGCFQVSDWTFSWGLSHGTNGLPVGHCSHRRSSAVYGIRFNYSLTQKPLKRSPSVVFQILLITFYNAITRILNSKAFTQNKDLNWNLAND